MKMQVAKAVLNQSPSQISLTRASKACLDVFFPYSTPRNSCEVYLSAALRDSRQRIEALGKQYVKCLPAKCRS